MTYLELYQSAFAEVGSLYPHLLISPVQGLVWLTEWVHEIQNKTGAVKKTAVIVLDPNSQDGRYLLPSCPRDTGIVCEYFATLGAGTSTMVRLYDFDTFERYKNGDEFTGNNYIESSPAIYTVVGCDMWIYPFDGLSGTLRLYYVAELPAYSPGNTGEWAGWGQEPQTRMAQNSIPREMRAAERNIKAYCKAMMIQAIPQWKINFKNEYYENMAIANEGWLNVQKWNQPQGNKTPAIHRMGPVR